MFLSNLSSANEQKARKKTSTKKKTDAGDEVVDPALKRKRTADKPVLYKEGDDIPRDVLFNFLTTCDKMMTTNYNVEEIVMDSIEKGLGLNMAAVEFQRDVLENNFQIEKNFGCRYLSMIPMKHEGDEELIDAAKGFMFTALVSYTSAMKVRSHKYRADPSLKPKAGVPLPKKAILEFFEGCNALMAMPETKEELRMTFKQTGQPPGARVIEMQRSILVLMGYDPDFGVSCLNKVGQDFPGDREIMGKMQLFAACAETSCMIATMGDEQKEAFFKEIPPLMHHFPHMWIMQQRMQQQQMMAQQQAQMSAGGGAAGAAGAAAAQARLQEIEALKATGVLGLLSSPEGRLQIQELATKVQNSRTKVYEEVSGWNAEKRRDFFNNVAEHPLLVRLMEVGDNPMDKIKAFIDMSESDVDQMMQLALIVAEDQSLVQRQQQEVAGGGEPVKMLKAVSGVAATLGSLMNFNKFGPVASSSSSSSGGSGGGNAPPLTPPSYGSVDDHDHSHSHQHGPGCNHGPYQPARKDISSGAAESIDR